MAIIAVFGASGLTGSCLVEQAVERGHVVRAHVRDSKRLKLTYDRVTPIVGDALDAASVRDAITGAEAVFSCLNVGRTSGSPWAKLIAPVDLVPRAVQLMVDAMKAEGVGRILTVSAHGVGDSWERCSLPFRWFIQSTAIIDLFAEHAKAEEVMRSSGLEWTAVRPPVLTNGARKDQVRVDRFGSIGMFGVISRADVAGFMLDAFESGSHIQESPTIV